MLIGINDYRPLLGFELNRDDLIFAFREPKKSPIGVRAPLTITTSRKIISLLLQPFFCRIDALIGFSH